VFVRSTKQIAVELAAVPETAVQRAIQLLSPFAVPTLTAEFFLLDAGFSDTHADSCNLQHSCLHGLHQAVLFQHELVLRWFCIFSRFSPSCYEYIFVRLGTLHVAHFSFPPNIFFLRRCQSSVFCSTISGNRKHLKLDTFSGTLHVYIVYMMWTV